MSNINEQLERYKILFNALGVNAGLTKIIILEHLLKIGKGTEFTIPGLIKEIDLERTLIYAQIRFFHDYGFVTIKNAPPLPHDFFDWNINRRRRHKQRIHYPRRKIYIVDFRGLTKTIDKRIQILKNTKQWILDNADIPSNADNEVKD